MRWQPAVRLAAQQRLSIPTPPPNSPFWGGVPRLRPAGAPLTLTLVDALRLALAHNLSVLIAEEAVDRADGTRRWRWPNCCRD